MFPELRDWGIVEAGQWEQSRGKGGNRWVSTQSRNLPIDLRDKKSKRKTLPAESYNSSQVICFSSSVVQAIPIHFPLGTRNSETAF